MRLLRTTYIPSRYYLHYVVYTDAYVGSAAVSILYGTVAAWKWSFVFALPKHLRALLDVCWIIWQIQKNQSNFYGRVYMISREREREVRVYTLSVCMWVCIYGCMHLCGDCHNNAYMLLIWTYCIPGGITTLYLHSIYCYIVYKR